MFKVYFRQECFRNHTNGQSGATATISLTILRQGKSFEKPTRLFSMYKKKCNELVQKHEYLSGNRNLYQNLKVSVQYFRIKKDFSESIEL